MSSSIGPGTARFRGLTVQYPDPLVFYIEFKDIFGHGIYSFESKSQAPRVLDCGSHIGMSILHIKREFPDARVTGFEPDPATFPILQRNMVQNGYSDVQLIPAAVGDELGDAPFVSDRDGSRTLPQSQLGARRVPIVRLLEFLSEPVTFLKLNIEGAELDVLRDCAEALRFVDQIAVEYHGFEGKQQYLHEMLSILDDAGFKYLVHDFDSETNSATKPPFRIRPNTRFFLMIYARRLDAIQ